MPTTCPPSDAPLSSSVSSIGAQRITLPHGKICVAVQAESPDELIARAEAALNDAHFLEFRLDSLASHADLALQLLRDFLSAHGQVTAIATCRRRPNSGGFDGTLAEELEILAQGAEAGCRIVDLEVESAEEASTSQLAALRARLQAAGAELLVSFHDFHSTDDLDQSAERIEAFKPEFVKVVSTARHLVDNLAVLRLINKKAPTTRVVGIAMGEEGVVSRVLGPRAGAAFTFASSGSGTETAPGQVTARTLQDLYRAEQLDSATLVYGVAGNPIAHSLSPLMQNAAFRARGVNAVLLPLKVRALDDLLALVRGLPLAGSAVTMPLKLEVMGHLASMDALTARIGACNTLRRDAEGGLEGFNTDVAGVVRPLEKRLKLAGARIAVLGAGGAARAAVFGLVDQGAEVFVVNRTQATAEALATEAGAFVLPLAQLASAKFDVLINSTPCGMHGNPNRLPIQENELNADLVFDLVYNPLETPLLRLARERGIGTISGVEMFVQQGVRQFELWTGQAAPEAEMERVVLEALARKS
jgi:3-dehydroquinate dehydratase/shikimate dehydrogenase